MIAHTLTFDEFFSPTFFGLMREYAANLVYGPEEGPDGQTYQQVNGDVPSDVCEELCNKLTWIFGRRVTLKLTFFRLATEGVASPQWCHSDQELSHFAMFMHLNENTGSTVLLRHFESGFTEHPRNEEQLKTYHADKNNYHAWEQTNVLEGTPNRAIIIRSDQLHAPMPMSGMGQTTRDGRLMLISFFDI